MLSFDIPPILPLAARHHFQCLSYQDQRLVSQKLLEYEDKGNIAKARANASAKAMSATYTAFTSRIGLPTMPPSPPPPTRSSSVTSQENRAMQWALLPSSMLSVSPPREDVAEMMLTTNPVTSGVTLISESPSCCNGPCRGHLAVEEDVGASDDDDDKDDEDNNEHTIVDDESDNESSDSSDYYTDENAIDDDDDDDAFITEDEDAGERALPPIVFTRINQHAIKTIMRTENVSGLSQLVQQARGTTAASGSGSGPTTRHSTAAHRAGPLHPTLPDPLRCHPGPVAHTPPQTPPQGGQQQPPYTPPQQPQLASPGMPPPPPPTPVSPPSSSLDADDRETLRQLTAAYHRANADEAAARKARVVAVAKQQEVEAAVIAAAEAGMTTPLSPPPSSASRRSIMRNNSSSALSILGASSPAAATTATSSATATAATPAMTSSSSSKVKPKPKSTTSAATVAAMTVAPPPPPAAHELRAGELTRSLRTHIADERHFPYVLGQQGRRRPPTGGDEDKDEDEDEDDADDEADDEEEAAVAAARSRSAWETLMRHHRAVAGITGVVVRRTQSSPAVVAPSTRLSGPTGALIRAAALPCPTPRGQSSSSNDDYVPPQSWSWGRGYHNHGW